jgi:putative FmdB family regulatory protein
MPIYEYRCSDCGAITEFIVYATDKDFKASCTECESENVVRLISCSSFALKGGGWAKDGYAKK